MEPGYDTSWSLSALTIAHHDDRHSVRSIRDIVLGSSDSHSVKIVR